MDPILALQQCEARHAPLPDKVDLVWNVCVWTELVTAMRGA